MKNRIYLYKCLFVILILFYSYFTVKAEIKLPKIFGHHMVLQQNRNIVIWGWGTPGESVSIFLEKQKASGKIDKDGTWQCILPAMKAGGPFVLTVKGKNSIQINDVMIGEVWLCSGQSNMQFDLKSSKNGQAEITKSNNPLIRQFAVPQSVNADPCEDLNDGEWLVSTPATSPGFPAVAYYYAKELVTRMNVAIGIVNASWGGTFIEDWISFESLRALPDYASYHDLSAQELEGWYSQTEKKYDNLFSTLGITDRNNIIEDSINWCKPEYNDTNWATAQLPARFDYDLLPRFDGVVWFRRDMEISEEMAKKGVTIHLGRIDDYDITYVNGVKVGSTMGDTQKRRYFVKPELLKPGKNSIAIRITDYWERGGFLNDETDFKITSANADISLTGNWKMNLGKLSFMWLRSPNVHPNLLYNSMIYPLRNYEFSGVVWYQGENNTMYASQYEQNLKTLVQDWRNTFTSPEMPFYIVQLPNMDHFNTNSQNGGSNWAELRDNQLKALEMPATYLAVTIDLGDSTNVHPTNKEDVGKRLGLLSLKNTYKMNIGEVASPTVKTVHFEENKAIVTFDHVGHGLIAKDKYGYLNGFEVAGTDKKFYWARAVIEGGKVIIMSDKVTHPVAVRYAWSSNPSDANLYNIEGFPASPFRSDTWESITQNDKYRNWIK